MPAGRALIDLLPHSVTDPATTAVWEQALDDISNNKGTLEEFLGKSVTWITGLVGNVKVKGSGEINGFSGLQVKAPAKPQAVKNETQHPCPQCGLPMCRRKSARGWFWGCTGYPECKATLPDKKGRPTPRAEKPSVTDGPECPQCKTGRLVERTARKGKNSGNNFLGCSCFPKCRFTRPVLEQK